jgi:hypothetical protein
MELDLQSLFGLHVHSCTHLLRPRNNSITVPVSSKANRIFLLFLSRWTVSLTEGTVDICAGTYFTVEPLIKKCLQLHLMRIS